MRMTTLLLAGIATAALLSPAFARKGADDPQGHVRGEGLGHPDRPVIVTPGLQFAKNGADDGAGHDANDDHGNDGAGHDANDDNGADGAGHDANDDRGVDGAGHDVNDDRGNDDSTIRRHKRRT